MSFVILKPGQKSRKFPGSDKDPTFKETRTRIKQEGGSGRMKMWRETLRPGFRSASRPPGT